MASKTAMRVGFAQMNSVSGDKPRNVARAVELLGEAAGRGADLVVLPEFFNVEYFAQHRDYKYLDYAEPLSGPSITEVAAAAARHHIWTVATILEREKAGFFYDTAVLIDREGRVHGTYRKTHPAAVYSLEKIYFRFGSHFPVFDVEGWPVGILICYDTFFPEVARTLALRGAELLVAPFAAPKHSMWRQLHTIRAFENGCFLVVCNKVGQEDEWRFSGESLVATPSAELPLVASDECDEVGVVELDRSLVDTWRRRFPMFRDRRPDLYGALVAPTEDLRR
jgi:predicted amidohydrolase